MCSLSRDAHELTACVTQSEPHLTVITSVTSQFLLSVVSLLLLLPLFLTLQSSETMGESMSKKDASSCWVLNFLEFVYFVLFYFVFVVTVEVVKEEEEDVDDDEEDDENDKEEKDQDNSKSDSSEREEL